MAVYYNEIDPYPAQWLRNLMTAGLIPAGDVDERSIADVKADDLKGYTQCHFFAGIAGWPLALKLAGWSAARAVWTGSCPCQPFSVAGAQAGFKDPRHLWPEFHRLIAQRRPPAVLGEQVAGASAWVRLVRGDLETLGYAVGFIPLEAASADADHFRDRYWFVAHAHGKQQGNGTVQRGGEQRRAGFAAENHHRSVAHDDEQRSQVAFGQSGDAGAECATVTRGNLGNVASIAGRQYIECPDGKWRRLPPPRVRWLGNGSSAAMVRLRAVEVGATQEVIRYAEKTATDPDKVLRMVQDTVQTEARRQGKQFGMRVQLSETEVLLCFLRRIAAALKAGHDASSVQKTLDEEQLRIVRGLRAHEEHCRPSCGWKSAEQRAEQPANSLLGLSLVLARHAEAYQETARSAHAVSDRVAKLRALGNAIDPRPAAAFIQAVMAARP